MGKFRLTDQKKCFYIFTYNVIELADRFLVIKIRSISQTPDQVMGIHFFAKMNSQSLKNIHLDFRFMFEHFFNPFFSILYTEKGLFLRINANGDDDLIKKR